MPFRRRSNRRSSPLRSREWIGFNSVNAGTGSPAQSIAFSGGVFYASYILSPDEMTTLYDEPTLMRCMINWQLVADTNVTGDNFFGMGIIKSSIEAPGGALAAGAFPFIPLPFYDADSPWIWYRTVTIRSTVGTVPFGAYAALTPGQGSEDVKTRRKFEGGSGLLAVAFMEASAVTTWRLSWGGRILFVNR